MDETARASHIYDLLLDEYPKADIMLKYESDFQLLVAVILSAQTTDKQVNKVVVGLFAKTSRNTSRARRAGS